MTDRNNQKYKHTYTKKTKKHHIQTQTHKKSINHKKKTKQQLDTQMSTNINIQMHTYTKYIHNHTITNIHKNK